MMHVRKTLTSLYALDKGKSYAELRGKTRIPVAEDNGRYTTVGLKPNRGWTGITESWPSKLSGLDKERIIYLKLKLKDTGLKLD
jgi:hypothetical protein